MQTHCPWLRHISKAYVQRPLRCFLNSESHRPGRKERQMVEVLRHKEAFASLGNQDARCRYQDMLTYCDHVNIPFGWEQKGSMAPVPELSLHTCKAPRRLLTKAPFLSDWVQSPSSRRVTKVSNSQKSSTECRPTLPVSQALTNLPE